MQPIGEVARDFDAIAAALQSVPSRGTLTPAEAWLLRRVPEGAASVLDVGCGDGTLARSLARRSRVIHGVDVSPRMIALAQARTGRELGIAYACCDVMTVPASSVFDVVVCVNMVHHVELSGIVQRLTAAVAPAGMLLIQDVVTRRGVRYFPTNVAAMVQSRARGLIARSKGRSSIAAAYKRHGINETYLSPHEVERCYREFLPGAQVKHHLEWRYSIVWRCAPAT